MEKFEFKNLRSHYNENKTDYSLKSVSMCSSVLLN